MWNTSAQQQFIQLSRSYMFLYQTNGIQVKRTISNAQHMRRSGDRFHSMSVINILQITHTFCVIDVMLIVTGCCIYPLYYILHHFITVKIKR